MRLVEGANDCEIVKMILMCVQGCITKASQAQSVRENTFSVHSTQGVRINTLQTAKPPAQALEDSTQQDGVP